MITYFMAVYLCLKSKIQRSRLKIRLTPSIVTLEITGVRIDYWLFIVREKMPALNIKTNQILT
jgi:hypothetical protein